MEITIILFSLLGLILKVLNSSNDEAFQKWINRYITISGNEVPPKFYKEWILIAREMGCSEDPYEYKQIFSDLEPFKNQNLTVQLLVEQFVKIRLAGPYVEARIMQEIVELSKINDWAFRNSLELVPRFLDPDVDFVVITHKYDEALVVPADDPQNGLYLSMKDVLNRSRCARSHLIRFSNSCMLLQAPASFVSIPYKIPIFGASRLKGYSDILLPTTRNGLPVYAYDLNVALNSPTWREKKANAMFRGRTTGIDFLKARLEQIPLTNNPRFKLHEMAMHQKLGILNCSVNLDFGLTDFWQYNDDPIHKDEISKRFPCVKSLNFEAQFKSKYQVIVDGNAWPDRVAFYLLSGSLIFLSTLHEEWVLNQLVDGEHYIKVKPDLSDLIDKLEWASKNDDIAERIAHNGRDFSRRKFNINQIQIYNALLFMEYQRIFARSDDMDNALF